jgi:hypothetical protein
VELEDLAMQHKSKALALAAASVLALSTYVAHAEDEDAERINGSDAVEISAGQLADRPAAYMGQRVKVRAEVEDVHTPRVFTLDEDEVGASPDVLVLGPTGSFPKGGQFVEVTGTVRAFVRSEIERDYEWFDLGDEFDVKFTERPVIVAESVLPVDEE